MAKNRFTIQIDTFKNDLPNEGPLSSAVLYLDTKQSLVLGQRHFSIILHIHRVHTGTDPIVQDNRPVPQDESFRPAESEGSIGLASGADYYIL